MKFFRILIGMSIGLVIGLLILYIIPDFQSRTKNQNASANLVQTKGQVIGFLPSALLARAAVNYEKYITTLAYFGLTIDTDGTILRRTNPQETEPGWNALDSGKVTPFLTTAKKNNVSLSLVMYNGDNDTIDTLMTDPVEHANNLTNDVIPVMRQYRFSDLNVDIESTETASPEAQKHFIQFIQTIKKNLTDAHAGTLTVEVSTLDVINQDLIMPQQIAKIADSVVLMAYDYHSLSSSVTGPIAPLSGAGIDAEYDVTSALQKALLVVPRKKLVLGIPLYGYEWETLGDSPRSAIIPGAGGVLSSKRAENVLAKCATCSAQFDTIAQESYVIYQDSSTGAYHQLFYPDKNSTLAKITLARTNLLGGLGVWALGYEGDSILSPLTGYRK